jgi:uncharacterized membrane protein
MLYRNRTVPNAEHYIARWQAAHLIDGSTAEALRAFEASDARPASRQWQVLLALILGGILLGAGVLLFVAAHWDSVSPGMRLALVLSMLLFFHGLGIFVKPHFAGFATAMHALATVSCGAAIALVGQIFNMQEHWPAAILVWALCAGAGWLLLGDQFQQTLTLLLFPAWFVCEFQYRVQPYRGGEVYVFRVLAVLAAFYLVAFLRTRRSAVFGILFAVGAIMLAVSVGFLGESGWQSAAWGWGSHDFGFVPLSYRIATLVLIALILAAGAALERRSCLLIGLTAALAYALPWLQTRITTPGWNNAPYTHYEATVLSYGLVALLALAFVAWGVHTVSKALVNYGIAAFALTVLWFYGSDIMDKLGRSLGLITLGILFLGGGWALERARRSLVARMAAAPEGAQA